MALLSQSALSRRVPIRRSGRRLIILAVGDPQSFMQLSFGSRRRQFDIVSVLSPDPSGPEGELAAALAPEALRRQRIWGIVVVPHSSGKPLESLLEKCRLSGIRVFDENGFYEQEVGCVDINAQDSTCFQSTRS